MAKAAAKLGSFALRLVAKGPVLAKGTVTFAQPRLQTFWKYAKVELRPPSFSEMPQVQQGFANIMVAARAGKWKTMTIRDATLNMLICLEIFCIFMIGEVIGKGNLIGYSIPGAVHYDFS